MESIRVIYRYKHTNHKQFRKQKELQDPEHTGLIFNSHVSQQNRAEYNMND